MRQPMFQKNFVDRRRAPRFDASAIPSLRSVHLGEGPGIKLINISRVGALIETHERMSIGTSVSLRFVTTEIVYSIEGRIVRINVDPIDRASACQCAIAFDKDFTILPSAEGIH
jgi:hypothetical protein